MASVLSGLTRSDWFWPNGRTALLLLLQAYECAHATDSAHWDFAVEISELRERGFCENELRWLLKMKYVEHRIEATLLGHETRCFLPQGGMKFTPNSCFILTNEGECYVRMLLHPPKVNVRIGQETNTQPKAPLPQEERASSLGCIDENLIESRHSPRAELGAADQKGGYSTNSTLEVPPVHLSFSSIGEIKSPELPKGLRPSWDMERKELWFGPHLIKRFRFQSPNQETILTVFHEEGWPAKIDDPLPPVPNQTSRQRLHDAIKNLNRHRLNQSIRFAGDGTGEGVRWEREG